MPITLFTGCSYTAGFGWEDERNDQRLWTNILHKTNQQLSQTKQLNLAESGSSNYEIFLSSAEALFAYRPRYAFVQWTDYPRHSVLLSVETYSSVQRFIPNNPCATHNLNNITYNAEYLNNIRDRFLSLQHPHQDILNIVKQTNILISIAKTTGTEIFFINGLCQWDKNFFDKISATLPSEFTPYTQELLNCSIRDDSEIFKLYNKIHSEYQLAGSINEQHWLNLYDSMRTHRVDVNNDSVHPGEKSNHIYADHFNQQLVNKLSS